MNHPGVRRIAEGVSNGGTLSPLHIVVPWLLADLFGHEVAIDRELVREVMVDADDFFPHDWSARQLVERTGLPLVDAVGLGKMPPYLPPAVSSAWAFELTKAAIPPVTVPSVLPGNGTNVGCCSQGFLGAVDRAVSIRTWRAVSGDTG